MAPPTAEAPDPTVTGVAVRDARPDDRPWITAVTRDVFVSEYQVTLRRQFVVTEVPLLVAERDGERVGFLGWEIDGDVCEALVLACTLRRAGVGRALMAELRRRAEAAGARALRVVTTDDNTVARAFYEALGFSVAEVRAGAVDECRRLYKPEIPPHIHDEVEYRLDLSRSVARRPARRAGCSR